MKGTDGREGKWYCVLEEKNFRIPQGQSSASLIIQYFLSLGVAKLERAS
jgi:hypothetical protein